MEINRIDQRVTHISKCVLDGKDNRYHCLLINISTAGALIEMTDSVPETIQVGDIYELTVLLLIPVKYNCKVSRISSNQIGLQFLEQ